VQIYLTNVIFIGTILAVLSSTLKLKKGIKKEEIMIVILITVVVLGILIWYAIKCIKQISTVLLEGAKAPVQAIITVWGKADRAVGQGLYWFWRPRDKIGLLIPTITYHLRFKEFKVHTKKKSRGEATKPVKVAVTIHLTAPRVGHRYEIEKSKIPSIWKDCVEKYETRQIERDGSMEDIEVGIIKGEDLLVKHLYPSLAPDKLFDSNLMAGFFKDATIDGVRARMINLTYTECRENKTEIEKEVKEYFLTDPANLFVKCGFPPENIDVSIISLESTEDVEHSLYAEEVAKIEGKAAQKEMDALAKAGVEKNIAAILVSGIGEKGKAIDFGALAQMGIALKFMGIQSPYQSSECPRKKQQ